MPGPQAARGTIGHVLVAVTVCIAAGLALAAVSEPFAAWLCRRSPRVDNSWLPVLRVLIALTGASLALLGLTLLIGSAG
jgi:hypothetical protein